MINQHLEHSRPAPVYACRGKKVSNRVVVALVLIGALMPWSSAGAFDVWEAFWRRGDALRKVAPSKQDAPSILATHDWPGWRGPTGQGIWTVPMRTVMWSEVAGVRWKTAIPGEGHSSPITCGEQVFVSTADASAQTLTLRSYQRQTGTLLWATQVWRGGFMFKHQKNSHASATPTCDGELVYLPHIANGLLWVSAVNLSGKLIWQKPIGPFVSEWGYASSLVLYKDLVIVVGDNRGSPNAADAASSSYVTAVRRINGIPVWRVPRPLAPSYGTPILIHNADRDQLVLGGHERIVAYDPATGKEIWYCRWSGLRIANSLTRGNNCVYATTTWPDSQILCIRADGSGDVTQSHLVWKQNRGAPDVPSSLFHDGRLYLVNDRGMVTCLKGEDGKLIWQHRLDAPVAASPVVLGDAIFVTDEEGTTHIFKAGNQFDLLAKSPLRDRVFASAAPSKDGLLLRSHHFLWCVDGKSSALPFAASKVANPVAPPQVTATAPAPVGNPVEQKILSKIASRAADEDTLLEFVLWGVAGILVMLICVMVLGIGLLWLWPGSDAKREDQPGPMTRKKKREISTMSPVLSRCMKCGKPLKVRSELVGKKLKCPACGERVQILRPALNP